MTTKVRNIHATDNRRIRLIPKNGAVGNPSPESAEHIAIDTDGTLAFCLTPSILCQATDTLFRALASSGKTFAVGEGVALAAKYIVAPMGEGDAFSESLMREYAENFFDPNEIVTRMVPNVQYNVNQLMPEIENWDCANGDRTSGIHVYFQDPSGASGVIGSNHQYPITINGTLHDLRFTQLLNDVFSYPTIQAFDTALTAVYTKLGDALKALGLGLDYEIVDGGPWVNAVGLGSIYTKRLLVKWNSKTPISANWGSPLITPGNTNSFKWWSTFVQDQGCLNGPSDWKTHADQLGVQITGQSSPEPMDQSEGWVIEIGTHEHFGLELPEGCVDYFTLCGLTDSVLVVSCPNGIPEGPMEQS